MPRLTVALVVLALAGAACRSRKAPPAETTAAPAVALAPTGAPTPGQARLAMRGAFTRSVDGAGTSCLGAGFQVGSADLDGPAARPAWTFVAYEQSPGAWLVALSLRPDKPDGVVPLYAWNGAPGAPHLVVTPTAATVALTLSGADGAVEVSGELRCPALPTAPVPAAITALLARHAGSAVRPYSTFDFGRARHAGAASAVVVGDAAAAEARLRRLRAELPTGWVAYLGTSRFLGDERPPEGAIELVAAPGAGPLDIVRTARTDAVNHDLMTEGIVRALAGWDRAWGIDVVRAETDTIELVLTRVPDDVPAFAREVYALCPDAVDQGVGTLAALEHEIATRRRVVLWWD